MKAYTPPLCLWSLVTEYVPVHEQEEIKSMLGESLVEQSQELHREIEALLEIWRDMREESSAGASPQNQLPEPPDQRDRLVQEICFFVSNVKETAEEKGIDPEYILKRHNSQILDYAAELSTRPASSKPQTSLEGRETPLVPLTYTRDDLALEMADELKTAHNKLNYLEFDQVCTSLRSTLEREVEQLLEDIQFLQGCLDCEADSMDVVSPQLTSAEPTLLELREERFQLEKDLMATNKLTATPQVAKPNFNTSNAVLPITPPGKSESSPQKNRPVPLKADHSMIGAAGEIKSTSSDVDLSSTAQTKEATTHKPHSPGASLCGDSISKSKMGHTIQTDNHARNLMPSLIQNGRTARSSSLNSPSQSPKRSDVNKCSRKSPDSHIPQNITRQRDAGQIPRKPLGTQTLQKISGNSQSFSSTESPSTKHDGAAVAMGVVRRRTASPARVRVVELTAVMDTFSNRDDPSVQSLSTFSTSTTAASIATSPPSSSLKANSALSPSGVHAERFRNMVLECRDGE